MIKNQISPGGCCTLELKNVHHHDHNYESSRQFLFCSAASKLRSSSLTQNRYMFGEATKHLFLKYLSYMTKTTQEESWVSQSKECFEIKRTVGQRWEKNVCKHRRRRSLLHLSCSAVAVPYPNQFLAVYGLHYQPYSWTRGLRFMKLENGGGVRLGRLPPRQ